MDYEKRYNDALEKAIEWEKKYILTNIISPDSTMAKEFKEIFPQLADSEEERIRKWLIKEMRRFHDCAVHEMCREDIDKTETALAWLEKQKERGPLTKEEERTLQDIILHLEDEGCPTKWKDLLHDIYNLPYTKQKEQKPVDYDHEMWKNCEANFESGKNEVIEHPEKYGLQKPAEWSEEDENKLNHILEIVHIASGREVSIDEKEELESFLKSLRPQPHWKPSEEQMKALEVVIHIFPQDAKYRKELELLKAQLNIQ